MRPVRWWLPVAAIVAVDCQPRDDMELPEDQRPQGFEMPVVTNANSPVEYPASLFQDQVEGVVVLHLYIEEDGTILADSTRIEESSGYPALDSAALQSTDRLIYAPARNDGIPVATSLLQPVHFKHPELIAAGENQ